jgi:hypothetical protein
MDSSTAWEAEAAGALRHIALDEAAKAYVLHSPVLYRVLYST